MLRVLSLPGKNHENQYFRLFCEGLEENGAKVRNVRDFDSWLGRFDVFHVHFPIHFVNGSNIFVSFFFSVVFITFFVLTRLLRKRLIYTIHDVLPFYPKHNNLIYLYIRSVHALCNGFVFLSSSSRSEFAIQFPEVSDKPFIIVGHGPYPTQILDMFDRQIIREQLLHSKKDNFVIGFLGSIKEYKGADALKFIPKQLATGQNVSVVIAGTVEERYRDEFKSILDALPDYHFVKISRKLPDPELNGLIQSVDAVLLPYSKGWNSGAAFLVLSNRQRIISSDLPMFLELQKSLGTKWITTFHREEPREPYGVGEAVQMLSSSDIAEPDRDVLAKFLQSNDFYTNGRKLLDFYLSC